MCSALIWTLWPRSGTIPGTGKFPPTITQAQVPGALWWIAWMWSSWVQRKSIRTSMSTCTPIPTGCLMGGSGGHTDAAAGAKLTMILAPLVRARPPIVTDRVTCISTPGASIDVLVTQRGHRRQSPAAGIGRQAPPGRAPSCGHPRPESQGRIHHRSSQANPPGRPVRGSGPGPGRHAAGHSMESAGRTVNIFLNP